MAPEGLRRRRWIHRQPENLTVQQGATFATMQLRKMQRKLNGAREREDKGHLWVLFLLVLAVFGLGATFVDGNSGALTLSLQFWQIAAIGAWFLLCIVVTAVIGKSKYTKLVWWMLVYMPLLAVVASLMFYGTTGFTHRWLFSALVVAECLAVLIFLGMYYFYPRVERWVGPGQFRNIRVVSDWTMTYAGKYGKLSKRHTCKYDGETNARGQPDGPGRWMDDSWNGEVLTGYWKGGAPVAPFTSRQYGTGDTFRAVRIAYFAASDDEFDSNRLYPRNEAPARCGVASVECSVSGSFYNHLPEATELFGPHVVGEGGASIGECCQQLITLGKHDNREALVEVKSSQQGLQVFGHVYAPTGLAFSDEPDQVIIDVHRNNGRLASSVKTEKERSSKFMPMASIRSSGQELIMVFDRHTAAHDPPTTTTDFRTLPTVSKNNATAKRQSENGTGVDPGENNMSPSDIEVPIDSENSFNYHMVHDEMEHDRSKKHSNDSSHQTSLAQLKVRNWTRSSLKEALVYIPGFNSCLKNSLETLGQFMVMSTLSEHVYPIIFAWPNGLVPTYRHASAAAATDRNKENFLQLLRSLSAEGINRVHFMSHSLGVQTLLGVFQDKDDGSRSDVSLCFMLDPEFEEGRISKQLMLCKSITMLNPDFPVEAFVDHAFLSIRRVCSHITVVGDRGDQALFYSQLINGMMNYLGYQQPHILNKKEECERRGFHLQRVIGRCIEMLHTPEQEEIHNDIYRCDERLLFQEVPPIVLENSKHMQERMWLDVDVIDTTSLDTNIQDLRHSAFNINPILINDLEELILTGNRASERSTLLYREGNIFSYCHAPSYVSF